MAKSKGETPVKAVLNFRGFLASLNELGVFFVDLMAVSGETVAGALSGSAEMTGEFAF
jgi:hypothetical protein